jgi:Ca2+-transporting ATPase
MAHLPAMLPATTPVDEPRRFRCVTEPTNADRIHAACIGGEQKRFSRWKPGSTVTFTVIKASFPSRKWASFAKRALVEAAEDWNAREVGIRFQLVRQSEHAVFALKYYRAPSDYLADAFAPDSRNRTLYIFNTPLQREYWPHLTNIFRHELGHVLGLRHEDAATREPEIPSVELTPANTLSIMNFYSDLEHFGRCSIQESDVMAIRNLCSLSEKTFKGFEVITVDPDALEPWSFEGSDKLSSIDSDLVSTEDSSSTHSGGPPSPEDSEVEIEMDQHIRCSLQQRRVIDLEEPTTAVSQGSTGGFIHGECTESTGCSDGHAGQTTPIGSDLSQSFASTKCDQHTDQHVSDEKAISPALSQDGRCTDFGNWRLKDNKSQHGEPSELMALAMELEASGFHLEDALTPDSWRGQQFVVEHNPFAFSPGQLGKLFDPKSLHAFFALGGLHGLEKGLRTDRRAGLSLDEARLEGTVSFETAAIPGVPKYGALGSTAPVAGADDRLPRPRYQPSRSEAFTDRKRVFGQNILPKRKQRSLPGVFWEVLCTNILLIVLAVVSVSSFAWDMHRHLVVPSAGDQDTTVWSQGATIIVFVVVAISTEAAAQWTKQRKLACLSMKNSDKVVKVIRSGRQVEISVYDILVGDVVTFSAGDIIPVDGILIEGHNVKCDESSCTGESDLLPKTAADDTLAILRRTLKGNQANAQILDRTDPFIHSGAKVQEGMGTFLATAVGMDSSWGRVMMSLEDYHEPGPQSRKLIVLGSTTFELGVGVAILLLAVSTVKFLATLPNNAQGAEEKGRRYLGFLTLCVALSVLAAQLFLSEIHSKQAAIKLGNMLKHNTLIRGSRGLETSAEITTICAGKTGILTQNKMRVVAATLGTSLGCGNTDLGTERPSTHNTTSSIDAASTIPDVSLRNFSPNLSLQMRDLLLQSIVINSTAFEGEVDGERTFVGSKTEAALMEFSRDFLASRPAVEERSEAAVVQQIPFRAQPRLMSTVVKLPSGIYRVYVKGAAESVLKRCSKITDGVHDSSSSADYLYQEDRQLLQHRIAVYGRNCLRPIGLSYRDFDSCPPEGFASDPRNMTMISIFGIKDPPRPGVHEAVRDCQRGGVFVRMVTGENLETACAVAREVGILAPGLDRMVLEGDAFRTMEDKDRLHSLARLAVLARATPDDKRILVRTLKELGEVVAVTGKGVNDGAALKSAQIGIAAGIYGCDAAKEAADVILMDENFGSIWTLITWGRAVNDGIKRFLQYKMTAVTTATILTFATTGASSTSAGAVLNATQLLWISLVTDFEAMALITGRPTKTATHRKPDQRLSTIITLHMTKMILGQAVCQLTIALVLFFGWFRLPHQRETPNVADAIGLRNTFVFNTFFWLQIFNSLNNRRLDNSLDIFEGISSHWLFFLVQFLAIGGHVVIMVFGEHVFGTVQLDGGEWGECIGIGLLCIPCGMLLRLIPDQWVNVLFILGRNVFGRLPLRPVQREPWRHRRSDLDEV